MMFNELMHKDKDNKSEKTRTDERYPGMTIHETDNLEGGADCTLPPNMYVASDYRRSYYGEAIIQHGYGHYLQYVYYGAKFYYEVIAPASLWFALTKNDYGWTEINANQLAHAFFGKNSLMGKNKYFPLAAPLKPRLSDDLNRVNQEYKAWCNWSGPAHL